MLTLRDHTLNSNMLNFWIDLYTHIEGFHVHFNAKFNSRIIRQRILPAKQWMIACNVNDIEPHSYPKRSIHVHQRIRVCNHDLIPFKQLTDSKCPLTSNLPGYIFHFSKIKICRGIHSISDISPSILVYFFVLRS